MNDIMPDIVCTLFEGSYHYGVGALVNSLYENGFRGDLYMGYRGDIAPWINQLKEIESANPPDTRKFKLNDDVYIHFLKLDTEYHFTNYKPDFMLEVFEREKKAARCIYYFDPDIVVNVEWDFFQRWKDCGVAVSEDVNSPLPKYHPRRVYWRNYYKKHGLVLNHKNSIYVNGGCVGVSNDDIEFLEIWKKVQELMAPAIGGLSRSNVSGEGQSKQTSKMHSPFNIADQDALNIAVEVYQDKISYIGKEAMGFKPGPNYMFHAIGKTKPWNWKSFKMMINGKRPRNVDKEYWRAVNRPIVLYGRIKIIRMKLMLKVGALVGRFYSRN